MKNFVRVKIVPIASAGIIILISFIFLFAKQKQETMSADVKGFAVVELFTSEGCSSCPAADEAIAALLAKNNRNIYILSFHVDYWNRLGWKDQFSKHEYSERQQQYARYLKSESVYTPQVIVNGTTQFVGSNEGRLNAAIKAGLQNGQQADLKLRAEKKDNSIIINYNIEEREPVILNTALVQPHASTEVRSGENGGRILQHVNIVRALKAGEAKGAGELTIDIPKELSNTSFQLIAFTQSKQNHKVLGVGQVNF